MRALLLGAALACGVTTNALALGPADDRVPTELTKFARGWANVLVGMPSEVVGRAVLGAHSEEGLQTPASFVGEFLMGAVYGLGWGAVRMGTGVVDIFTFPVVLTPENRPIVPLDPDWPL
jgi:putative exosortase-associated protein (TIGR04073 family)